MPSSTLHKKRGPEAERPSLQWPHLYDILRAQGYSQEKAARISNSRRGTRKKGRLTTAAGRKAAQERKAAKLSKGMQLAIGYLTPEEVEKVSTKGLGFKKKRKARRKSIGVHSLRHRRIGRHRALPRAVEHPRAEAPTARGRHGRNR